jgi:stringent starvation protein B
MTSSKPYLIRAIYEWIVDNNLTPYITVDTSISGTAVPNEYIVDEQIVLDISTIATHNLIINNEAIEFKARFNGISRSIYIPIAAVMVIYAKENARGMSFAPEDFEEEFAEEAEENDNYEKQITITKENKPQFKLVTGGKELDTD